MSRPSRRIKLDLCSRPPELKLSAVGLLRRYARVGGAGLGVFAGAAFSSLAGAATPPFGSGAWFAQQRSVATTGVPAVGAPIPNTPVNSPAAITTPQQALQHSSRAMANLSRAAQAITAAQSAQTAARQLSLTQPNPAGVADGLTAAGGGGLTPHASAAQDLADPVACGTYGCTWLNARLPTETVEQNRRTVTVEQTADKAILNWSSFNVGRNTTLYFDQRAGTAADGSNNWIALNRIANSASPSQILGQIKAEGSVYLINPRGFLFGGSSTVNVHSLLVTTLNPTAGGNLSASDFDSNRTYLGPGTAPGVLNNGNLFLQPFELVEVPVEPEVEGEPPTETEIVAVPIPMGNIEVAAGARLQSGDNGYLLLAAPNLRNAGHLLADDGQIVLAAGSGMSVDAGASGTLSFSLNAGGQGVSTSSSLPPGELLNTGLIQAQRGGISLVASDVRLRSAEVPGTGLTQHSTIVSSTSLSRPGSISIKADNYGFVNASDAGYTGVVEMGPGTVLALLPDDNDETTTSSDAATAAFKRGSIRIRGGSIRMMGDSLIVAPGQNVSLDASVAVQLAEFLAPAIAADGSLRGRVYLDSGAVIDVSGLADVQLPMSANLIAVPRVGQNELADSPLLRNTFLFRASISVDAREQGTRDDGSTWFGTSLANVNGYVDLKPRGIAELLQDGGDIALAGFEIIAGGGSQLNLDGGYLHYLGGTLETTRLLASNGAIIDIADADPDRDYDAFAGVTELDHPRANLTEFFRYPILAGGYDESAYIHGGNAGKLSLALGGLYAGDYQPVGYTQILNGDISAAAYAGRYQVADNALPHGGRFAIGRLTDEGSLRGGALSYRIVDQATRLAGNFGFASALPGADGTIVDPWNHPELPVYWSQVSGVQLANAGFSEIELVTSGAIRVEESGLSVQPGGSIGLTGSVVTLAGNLTARAGEIEVTALGRTAKADVNTGDSIFAPGPTAPAAALPGNIEVLAGITLSTRGFWVNDTGRAQDAVSGDAYIHGGRISLVTSAAHAGGRDLTGSVLLYADSTLDVSGGGYVAADGRLATDNGVALGRGGDIELAIYDAPPVGEYTQQRVFTDIETGLGHAPSQGRLQMDGTMLAHGFAGGGELRLQALGFNIGEQASTVSPPGTLQLHTDFFTGQGFSSYELAALYNVTIVDGVIRPTQAVFDSRQSFNLERLLAAPTGSDLYTLTSVGAYAALDGLADLYGQYRGLAPTSLALYAGGYLGWAPAPGSVEPEFPNYASLCTAGQECITGVTELRDGARIEGEHGARITLGSQNQVTVLGSIVAHGGTIVLTGDTGTDGYAEVPDIFSHLNYASVGKSVWLGASSLLDVSGVALIDRLATPQLIGGVARTPHTGEMLDGGRVVLSNDSGYVLAQAGARIDVSGASAVFELPNANTLTAVAPQAVWSDAGSIVLGAGAGLYFDVTLAAQAGAAADGSGHGRGGTLTIAPESTVATLVRANGSTTEFTGADRLVVSQHGPAMPAGAAVPGAPVESANTTSGDIHFAADWLDGSGIDDLYLGKDPQRIIDASSNPLLPIEFAQDVSGDGNIRVQAGRAIVLNTAVIGLDDAALGVEVTLVAPYVALHRFDGNPGALPPQPTAAANARLTVEAEAIDFGGRLALDDFSIARFISSGDIRFATPLAYGNVGDAGALLSGGDLLFEAERIYPATANRFVIAALGGDKATTITFRRPDGAAAPATPLSAGGALLVDATHIVQSGALFAPQGQIALGVSDPGDAATRALFAASSLGLALAPTASVQLAAGSLTSVSLGGATVLFGATVDGTDLLYARNGGANAYLDAPPEKDIRLAGLEVALDAGATLDIAGGGHLQAQEFIPGTGGTRDVLAGDAVYAILPGDASALAAFDPQLASDPLLGRTVHLSGVPGLPEGDYTLLPGRYATLPGAYRLVQDTAATDVLAARNLQLADGTHYVAGWFVDGFNGARDARSTAFYLQSTDAGVWQQYAEYQLTDADTFFAAQASRAAATLPQLTRDAGRLVLAPTQTLSSLAATLNAAPATDGARAQIDLASAQIQITASGQTAAEGYVGIAAAELNALNAGSLLIGGTRTRSEAGDFITPIASSVIVANGSETLSAPEILLVAQGVAVPPPPPPPPPPPEGVEPPAEPPVVAPPLPADSLVISAGSRIEAIGEAPAGVPILIGRVAANGLSALSGDGALLRISSGDEVSVSRANTTASGNGVLVVGAGAQLAAGGGSITLDSSGSTRLDPSVGLSAAAIGINASLISFLGSGAVPGEAAASGVQIGDALLAQLSGADRVSLASRGAMDFVGDLSLAFDGELALGAAQFNSRGGSVAIDAATLTLGNLLGSAAGSTAEGSGSLQLSAETLSLSGGSTAFAGFAQISATALDGVLTQAVGSFDVGAAQLQIATPLLIADAGSDTTLRSSGAVTLGGASGGEALALAPLGGQLSLVGAMLDVDTQLQALGGKLALRATAADTTLGANAVLSVRGAKQTYFDVDQYASAGTIALESLHGNVVTAVGAQLDFAAVEGGGDAGRLSVAAPEGQLQLDATLDGAAANGQGGSLQLDLARGLTELDTVATALATAGIDHEISIRTRESDLTLASTLKGDAVALSADGGAVRIATTGLIDASGAQGGEITLYGQTGVELQGKLDAHATQDGQRGGDVTLGTNGVASGAYDPVYGYQLVNAEQSGTITLGATAVIDVSGSDPANELPGGRVHLRAPLLAGGGVNVFIDPAAQPNLIGARDLTLEAYARWSTTDGTLGAQHFDGLIDPAGRYDSAGLLIEGGNLDHAGFYASTLLNYVRTPGFAFEPAFAGLASFHARPGIDLVNPDATINGGDIRVLSHWNLGAGTRLAEGSLDLLYRYQSGAGGSVGGNAPVLGLRAAGNVQFLASLSDGFFQYNNPFPNATRQLDPLASDPLSGANGISPQTQTGLALPLLAMSLAARTENGLVVETYDSSSYRIVAGADFSGSDPLARSSAAIAAGLGDVLVDGHASATVSNSSDSSGPPRTRTMVAPTMIRTGVGTIAVAAADDIELRDPVAPGVIYTAGRAAANTPLGQTATVIGRNDGGPWIVDTGESHPLAAGDLSLVAAGDIAGYRGVVDSDGSRTGTAGAGLDAYWWPWMQGLCASFSARSASICGTNTGLQDYGLVNFAAFGQGLLSAGGDVRVTAGGALRELSVSLPTTYVLDAASARGFTVLGGGSLQARAGGDIAGSDFFVSRGSGLIDAGGSIGSSTTAAGGTAQSRLALQDAQLSVRTRLGAELGDVLNPSYMAATNFDLQPYGTASSLRIEVLAGDVRVQTTKVSDYQYSSSSVVIPSTAVWPATVAVAAFNGALDLELGSGVGLSAAPRGQLGLFATDTITIAGLLGLFDIDPARMPSPAGGSVRSLAVNVGVIAAGDHERVPLHAGDTTPVYIYSRDGDLVIDAAGSVKFFLLPNKPAWIRAGRDIVDLSFIGQHLYESDLSVIAAGRDLYYDRLLQSQQAQIEIGGPGTLLVSAGRDIGPLPRSNFNADSNPDGTGDRRSGIRSVGNVYNPYLSRGDGANLLIEFGVAPGVAVQEFAQAYLAPDRSVDDVPDYSEKLIAFVQQIQADAAVAAGSAPPPAPTAADAWAVFQQLPLDQQKRLVYAVFYDILDTVGLDYNNRESEFFGQYARGFAAIENLFPAGLGYTANNRSEGGGGEGAQIVSTGSMDMRGATVQTRQGGDLSFVGPGGGLLVGSTAAPPVTVPSREGILALQQGSIRIFTDQSTLLAQSRIFAQQGGDLLLWSSNGDINAGKGAKTISELASAQYICFPAGDRFCFVDASGQVSGAGIATLQTIPGAEPGSANLIAPRGTVDAGDAGIRVSGNLNVAALQVANADNIQVQGDAVGVPTSVVNAAALAAAGSAAASANDAADDLARSQAPTTTASTLITVDVLGFGAMDDEEKRRRREAAEPTENTP